MLPAKLRLGKLWGWACLLSIGAAFAMGVSSGDAGSLVRPPQEVRPRGPRSR